jgi:hypothetical protein
MVMKLSFETRAENFGLSRFGHCDLEPDFMKWLLRVFDVDQPCFRLQVLPGWNLGFAGEHSC